MRNYILSAVAALTLVGCETATPYQPVNAPGAQASGGYSDQRIEPDRWRVSFSGNALTDRETVERYLLFRAAQLTLQQGYDWFETTDRHTERNTQYVGDLGDWGPMWGLYGDWGWRYGYWGGPGWADWDGWGGWGGGPVDIEQVSRYNATAEIVMGHGRKPNDPHAFDAHAVVASLGPTIHYPDNRPARS